MSALTLVGEVLLHIEIYGMLVCINSKHRVVQHSLAAGVFTFYVVYCEFHYFSIITIEPLLPGIEPLIIITLCSGITFTTLRF